MAIDVDEIMQHLSGLMASLGCMAHTKPINTKQGALEALVELTAQITRQPYTRQHRDRAVLLAMRVGDFIREQGTGVTCFAEASQQTWRKCADANS